MKTLLKQPLMAVAARPPTFRVLRSFLKRSAMIFMFHRFEDPDTGVTGHSPGFLADALTELRRQGVRFVSTMELLDLMQQEKPLEGSVAFTVDDGYGDFHRVAAPIFSSMDCPVTVFLPAGFLDEPHWLWWDRLRYLMDCTSRTSLDIEVSGTRVQGTWLDSEGRSTIRRRVSDLLRSMKAQDQSETLDHLGEILEVETPTALPDRYAPLTWDEVREDAAQGITFGPHTITHTSMGILSSEEAKGEVCRSWERICAETSAGVPVFCYPYGVPSSLLPQGSRILEECGMEAALTALPGFVSSGRLRPDLFRLPRFAWPEHIADLRQLTTGFEKVVELAIPGRRVI